MSLNDVRDWISFALEVAPFLVRLIKSDAPHVRRKRRERIRFFQGWGITLLTIEREDYDQS